MRAPALAVLLLLWGWGLPVNATDLLQSWRDALQNDPKFLTAEASLRATREELPKARANLLPAVNFTATYSKNDTERTSPNLFGQSQTAHFDYTSENYTLSLRQPLYRPQQWAQYKQAKAQIASAEAQFDFEREALGLRVTEAYFNALLAEDQARLAEAEKTRYEAALRQAELAYKAGSGTLTDILDSRARLDLAEAALIQARQQVEYTRRSLASLTGHHPAQLSRLDPLAMKNGLPEPGNVESWLARAEAANPLIQSWRRNVEVARQELEKANAGHHPTLDFVASLQKAASESAITINTDYTTRLAGIQFNLPLFAGGYVTATSRQAAANLDKALSQLEAARRAVELDVRKAHDGLVQGLAQVRALELALRSAEESARGTQKGIQAGTRTHVDLLDAERRVFEAQKELARARYAIILYLVQLKSAAGELDEGTIQQINGWLSRVSADPSG